jgi:pimeloyl-ACP methyl ester carboxylesterase
MHAFQIFVVVFSASALGIFGYVAGSFALMRGYTEKRGFAASFRAALRETFWVLLTQPILPLYFFFGRRMGRGDGQPVVFIHGYMQNRVNFLGLARALTRARVGPLYGFNYPFTSDIVESAKRLARFVEGVCKETGNAQVDLVAHSLGGLVALEYMHSKEGLSCVRRCITVASPHAGVKWRGPVLGVSGGQMRQGGGYLKEREQRVLGIPTLSIFSAHDNIVYPPATSALAARGGVDFEVRDLGHLAILFAPEVATEVARFLLAPGLSEKNAVAV